MKLLDPFAGYRLASGHEFFHLALFVGSFWVLAFGVENFEASPSIKHAFDLLRWGHFILVVFSLIEIVLTRPSAIPPKSEAEIEAPPTEEEKEMANDKLYHRDGSKKLFARILETCAVFIYQGAIFYAQMVLADELIDCSASTCVVKPV